MTITLAEAQFNWDTYLNEETGYLEGITAGSPR